MVDYHAVLAAISIAFGAAGYIIYITSIFRGATKPHVFTWLIYALVDVIVFAAQLVEGGGPGAWATALGAFGNAAIFLLALRFGEKRVMTLDRVCLLGALLGIVLWQITSNPLTAVVVLTITNTLAVVPTIRKSYWRPFEESISIWGLDIARFGLALFALSTFNSTTALFPAGVVVTNSVLVGMILLRRRALGRLF